MSQFFSGLITQNKTLWDYDSDSHEDLIKMSGLKDVDRSPDFVRVELVPIDEDIFHHNPDNWKLKVDQDCKPDWFSEKFAEAEMKKAIKNIWKKRFVINDSTWKECENQRVFVLNSKMVAWGKSSILATGYSSIVARDNSFIEVWEKSSIVARDNSLVIIPYSKYIDIKGVYDNAIIKDLSGEPKIIVANPKIKLVIFKEKMMDRKEVIRNLEHLNDSVQDKESMEALDIAITELKKLEIG